MIRKEKSKKILQVAACSFFITFFALPLIILLRQGMPAQILHLGPGFGPV